MENFQDRGVWPGSGFLISEMLDPDRDPDPVSPERLDLDPVNIRPYPKPCP